MIKFLKKDYYKYIGIIGLLSSWILCFNHHVIIGMSILSSIIGVLYVRGLLNKDHHHKHIAKESVENAESLEWVNTLLQRWWLFSICGTENYLRNKINKVLQSNTPEFFEFVKVENIVLGDLSPHANSVKLVDLSTPDNIPVYLTERSLSKLISFIKYSRCYSLLLELDINCHLNDTEIYLVCKHKKCRNQSKIILKEFCISGLVNMKITLDKAIAFPHINGISVYFSEKTVPKFDYNISLSNVSNLMDRFKFWITWIIHSNIIKQKFKLSKIGLLSNPLQFLSDRHCVFGGSANGVLVVKLPDLSQLVGYKNNFKQINLCTISMGSQIYDFQDFFHTKGPFSVVFLVQNFEKEQILIKLKSENPIGIQTLAVFNVNLKDYPLEVIPEIDITASENRIDVKIQLEYLRLNPIPLELNIETLYPDVECGVLYLDIIAAQNLLTSDHNNGIDPYCAIFANQYKILSTKTVKESRYPKWNNTVEFLVYFRSKITLTFVVYNERNQTDDGMHEVVGVGTCPLKNMNKNMINCTEVLKEFGGPDNNNNRNVGKINFTIIFRPVEAVEYASNIMISKDDGEESSIFATKQKNCQVLNEQENPLLQLQVKGAKNLVKKDVIGLSDPYFKIIQNGIEIHKSKIIKNTLSPLWNEIVKIPNYNFKDILKIELYDRDMIKKDDFMGHLVLNSRLLHDLSMFSESRWFSLENISDGDIHIEARFSKSEDLCQALNCHDNHDNHDNQESFKTMNGEDEDFSDSDNLQSRSTHTVHSDESPTKKKRLFGEINSVVLDGLYDLNVDEYILKADLRKFKLPSKWKPIIKAHSTSQIDKTIYFSNYAFAIIYCPSKENLKLKFKLIQKKSKKKVDECIIDIKRFAELLRHSKCQMTMNHGSLINIFCKEVDD